MIGALLARTRRFAPVPGKPPVRAVYPAGGFAELPLTIETDGSPAP